MSDRIEGIERHCPPASARRRKPPSRRRIERTGVDFSYLLAQARIESGLDPSAQARTSSASGLFQFIDQTWLSTLDRHGEALGYGEAGQSHRQQRRAGAGDRSGHARGDHGDLRFNPKSAVDDGGRAGQRQPRCADAGAGPRTRCGPSFILRISSARAERRQFLGALGQKPRCNPPPPSSPRRARQPGDLLRTLRRTALGGRSDAGDPGPGRAGDGGGTGGIGALRAASPNSGQPSKRTIPPQLPWAPFNAPSLPRYAPGSVCRRWRKHCEPASGLIAPIPPRPGLAHVRSAYARLEAFGL